MNDIFIINQQMELFANGIGAADWQQSLVHAMEFVDGTVPLVSQPALYALCEVVLSGRLGSDVAVALSATSSAASPDVEQSQTQANVRTLQLGIYTFLCGALDRLHAVLPHYTRLIVSTICTNIEVCT